ncbi:hypothetical protein PC122_g11865 [Phytophthora cactorum]|nr:hypothetical protein PC122_g11865 [Phytophthora cactorum]
MPTKRKGEAEEEKGDDNKKWLAQIDALKGVKDTSGYKELTIPDAKVRVVGLASDGLGEVSDEGGAAGRGPAHVLVEIPSDIDVKKFLEGEMIQRDRVISSPRILDDASSLNDLKQYVDNTIENQALLVLGHTTVPLKRLLPGALMNREMESISVK